MSLKQDIYELLKANVPEGVVVQQGSQGVDAIIPAVTFQAINQSVQRDLDGNRVSTSASIRVDIWAGDSPKATAIFDEVEEAMREADWELTGALDVPDTNPEVYHQALTFDTMIA